MSTGDPRRHSPAAERNRAAILTELLRRLPAQGQALEVASGTGQHISHFAAALPGWTWQPSDADPGALASIAALSQDAGLPKLLAPQALDLLADSADFAAWSAPPRDLVYCANLIHIAPWPACSALMRLAAACLSATGRLVMYGPYRVEGEPLQPGNQAFDADLRQRNPAWGLRWLHEVVAEARAAGLALAERVDMPANNLLLLFARADAGARFQVRTADSGLAFEAASTQTLLDAARAAGLALPSACRAGTCRRCLTRLHSGSVQYSVDWPGLSAEEKADGWVLPCVVYPRSDLVMSAPPGA